MLYLTHSDTTISNQQKQHASQKIRDLNMFAAKGNIKIDLIIWIKYELLLRSLSKSKHKQGEIPEKSSARSKPYQAHFTSSHL